MARYAHGRFAYAISLGVIMPANTWPAGTAGFVWGGFAMRLKLHASPNITSRVAGSMVLHERERRQALHVRRLYLTDLLVVCIAVATAEIVWFGSSTNATFAWGLSSGIGYTAVSVMLALLWTASLAAAHTRSAHSIGSGSDEYARVIAATFRLFGILAIGSLLLGLEVAQGYLAIAFPLGLLGLLANRWLWRRYTAKHLRRGEAQASVLVVGGLHAAQMMAIAFARHPASEFRVVGACAPRETSQAQPTAIEVCGQTIPIVGDDCSVIEAVRTTGADTVAFMATDHFDPETFRSLEWDLDSLGVDLIVAPGLVDIARPRLANRTIAGITMLYVERPQYERATSKGKAVFDFCFSLTALVIFLPVMIVAAIAVKISSRGPVFYLSERIGLDGKPFKMIKFRTMYTGADKEVRALIDANSGNPVFFKMKNDPRVTPVGRVMRKLSIDELPQFFNALRGDMSVVGPRPQVRREVDSYSGMMRRRLLVKPGITGLWQVSGRSDLPVEDAIRLDLAYVENWSMIRDLSIIARTFAAVIRGRGAY